MSRKRKSIKEATQSMLKHVAPPAQDMPASTVHAIAGDNQKAKHDALKLLRSTGSSMNPKAVGNMLSNLMTLNFRRRQFYRELERANLHAYVGGAVNLYADFVTGKSSVNGASVWVQSEDKTIENAGNAMLARIGIEERIRDWTIRLCVLGDHFVQPVGREGVGIQFVDDNIHPCEMDRIDINGRLEGFVRSDLMTTLGTMSGDAKDLEPPWSYVHFKTFGSFLSTYSSSFGMVGDRSINGQFGGVSLLSKDRLNRITTRYGSSIIAPAVPIYKTLQLSEDSVQLARVTRGMLWYLFKVKVSGGWDQAGEILTDYRELLKRQTGIDFSKQEWRDNFSPLYAQVEDLFIPETDDMTVSAEEYGGQSADIKGIRDIDMLESRLLGSLRVSKMMLGIADETDGAFGANSADRKSINFAKNASRVQAALGYGIKRLVQIELAYLGYNADPTRFDIAFGTISTAEEEELKNALETGVKIVGDVMQMVINAFGDDNVKKGELLDMLNQKVLKLDDVDFMNYVKNPNAPAIVQPVNDSVKHKTYGRDVPKVAVCESQDLYSYLPTQQVSDTIREKISSSRKGSKPAKKYSLLENTGTKNIAAFEDSTIWIPRKVKIEEVAEK